MTNPSPEQEDFYSNIPLAQTMVLYCKEKEIRHIVISPGSRNAPLTKGFTGDHYFETYSIVDERAAAFFALGLAQQYQCPTAIVCTSGSALLNYYPAVAEAFYSDIPLVVLSADRMPHRIDIGDGQTIRQPHVFEPHLEDAAYLKPDVIHATHTLLEHPKQDLLPSETNDLLIEETQKKIQTDNERAINRVLNSAIEQKGPVHINLPFEEPLYGTEKQSIVLQNVSLPTQLSQSMDYTPLLNKWQSTPKKMLLVGTLEPNSLSKEIIDFLAADPSLVILCESTSNLQHFSFLSSIDTFIAPLEENHELLSIFQPQLLITLGGMIVSKKIKAFLRKFSPQTHWHIAPKKAYDTFYCLTNHLKFAPEDFFSTLLAKHHNYVKSDYCALILQQYNRHRLRGMDYLTTVPFSDLKAFELIHRSLPNKILLQLANSSTIRYNQLFAPPALSKIYCNRGTSGIDGSTSTAMGAAWAFDGMTVFITGDLSFFYDVNGLWHNYLKPSTRIIVLNNGGGGIFRILPGEKDTPTYDTYFETIQNRSAHAICSDRNINYYTAQTSLGLRWELKRFFLPSSRPKLLEIKTPRKANDVVLLNYFRAMKEK